MKLCVSKNELNVRTVLASLSVYLPVTVNRIFCVQTVPTNQQRAPLHNIKREHLFELLDEAAVLQMSLEGLDGGGAVREAPDRREALHREMEGVGVLIAGSEVGDRGRGTHRHKHVCAQKQSRLRQHDRKVQHITIWTDKNILHTFMKRLYSRF